jgi:hypothetical protein
MMKIKTLLLSKKPTPAGSEEILHRRETTPGYTLIGAVYSNVHGIATYVEASFFNCRALYQDYSHMMSTLCRRN